ncbi:MAG: tRNA (adenosine(37)-N6)-dimethylallyltransferase MiaA [Gemmatimonadaceae bacterium]
MSSIDASADADLPIIAGPTGAGKSSLALRLAARHGARLISADSRQIYRGFDLGTAKPTAEECRRVGHDGIDIAEPTERWSAARWASDADRWIAEARARRQPVIVVGGTGLWLRALVQPLAAEPPMDPARRHDLQRELAEMPTEELRRWVERLDPPRARFGRAQLLRAAEVALLTGTRLSDHHAAAAGAARPRRTARWLIVDPGPVLAAQLDARRAAMVAAGWVAEVERLAATVPADAPAWNACGYRAIREMVRGTHSLAEALDAVRIATRQYAKRQRTWFRNQLTGVGPVTRLDPRAADADTQVERWFTHGVQT